MISRSQVNGGSGKPEDADVSDEVQPTSISDWSLPAG